MHAIVKQPQQTYLQMYITFKSKYIRKMNITFKSNEKYCTGY